MQETQAIESIANTAINALEDIKAKDIVVLDTTSQTPLFSRLIVASGDSTRQVKALARNVAQSWKDAGIDVLSSEGMDSGEWVLIDASDVVVHVMLPAIRDYYDIETLWKARPTAASESHS